MKRIYATVALLGTFAFGASAQRYVDLQVLHSVPSTVIIDSVNLSNTPITLQIVNNGPEALWPSDTVHIRTAMGNFIYNPIADLPMGDTLTFADTIQFTTGPADGPVQWCDSLWAVSAASISTAILVDTVSSNDEMCSSVTIDNRNGTTGIFNNSLITTSLAIYPNPAKDKINFKYNFPVSSEVSIRISDMVGRTALVKNLGKQPMGEKEFSLDISSLENGVYYIELIADNKRAINKLTVRK